ncbi:MAG: hypothetical protein HY711_08175 [Candidatus Melainabacteria bacterium]|nr:hypothetical protein [Candidatus Melainabacteria bacterium]
MSSLNSSNMHDKDSILPELKSRYRRLQLTMMACLVMFVGIATLSPISSSNLRELLIVSNVLLVLVLSISQAFCCQYRRLSWVVENVAPVESTVVFKGGLSGYTVVFGSSIMLGKGKAHTTMKLTVPDKRQKSLFTGLPQPVKVYFDPDRGIPVAVNTTEGLLFSERLSMPLETSIYLPWNGGRCLNWSMLLSLLCLVLSGIMLWLSGA